jgi:hypothetical protein
MKPSDLTADEDILNAVKGIANYNPPNPAYTLAALNATYTELQNAWQAETQAESALASARDNSVAKEWEFHNKILGVKDQVIALFGRNSNEVQAVGIKKASEYKSRKPSASKPEGSTKA